MEGNVNQDGSFSYRWIDSSHRTADNTAVTRINLPGLPNGNVPGLRLRDFDLRFQLRVVCYPGEIGTSGDSLPDINGNLLKDAVHSGSDLQRIDLTMMQIRLGFGQFEIGLGNRHSRCHGSLRIFVTLLFYLKVCCQF